MPTLPNWLVEFKAERLVAALAGVCVLLAAWLAWNEVAARRERTAAAPVAAPAPRELRVAPWPSVRAMVNLEGRKPPANCFNSVHIDKYLERQAAEAAARKAAAEAARLAAEEAARKAAEEAAQHAAAEAARAAAATKNAKQTPPPPPAPPPPPEPKFAEFVYRGLLQRTDGQTLALVESRSPARTNFYAVGETCRGVVITNIESRKVGLVFKDGTLETLGAGETLKVPEARVDGR